MRVIEGLFKEGILEEVFKWHFPEKESQTGENHTNLRKQHVITTVVKAVTVSQALF